LTRIFPSAKNFFPIVYRFRNAITYHGLIAFKKNGVLMRKRRPKRTVSGVLIGILICGGIFCIFGPAVPAAMEDITFIDTLYACSMTSPSLMWSCGFSGAIYHSNDKGRTWIRQESRTSQTLFDMCFFDDKAGIVCGQSGIILRTRDGGKIWEHVETPRTLALFKMSFADKDIGCAVGDRNYIIQTSDGGITWQEAAILQESSIQKHGRDQQSGETSSAAPGGEGSLEQGSGKEFILYGVSLADPHVGYAVGEFGTFIKTEDGGKTWKAGAVPEAGGKSLFTVYAETAKRVWVAGIDGIMFVTEDGGTHWRPVQLPVKKHIFEVKVKDGHGWAVGKEGIYLISGNGGTTWKQLDVGARFYLQGLCINSDYGMIVGAHGWILRTGDGGKSFQILRKFP
jgi:photosystem II stability/assembly factor-like uncharacterized protein